VAFGDLFSEEILIATDSHKAQRVLAKLEKIVGHDGVQRLLWAFLSENEKVEDCLLGVIAYAIEQSRPTVLKNYAHPQVLQLALWVKSVSRERHRMLAFVRFEKMRDGLFFARIEPDFNVLPLIAGHFRRRYQDQPWAIFDLRRDYGIHYDLEQVRLISDVDRTVFERDGSFAEDETAYQRMWQGYFENVTITERKNAKLHIQQLPKRYWQYLTEKKLPLGK
jgi:probable DNA metabolism protein